MPVVHSHHVVWPHLERRNPMWTPPGGGFQHVAKRVKCPRPAGIRAYFALTSPRLVTSGMSKPHVDAARRRVSTHVAKRVNCPRAAGIRALFCSHIISFHHISNSGSRSVASQRRITSHSPCRRCMSQAPAQCFSSAKQGDRDGF